MRRFQFALERFLDLRRWKEREWEIRLARATGRVIVLKNRIADIGAEIGASYGRSFTDGPTAEPSDAAPSTRGSARRVDIAAMARRELYVQRLAAERERRSAELAVRLRELEEVRARYLEAARERKVLDKLKDRRAAEYYEGQRDEDYKAIDDLNTASSLRGGE